MRCALVEAEVRDEVMREMETRMADMEDMYTRRLTKEVCFCCKGRVFIHPMSFRLNNTKRRQTPNSICYNEPDLAVQLRKPSRSVLASTGVKMRKKTWDSASYVREAARNSVSDVAESFLLFLEIT